MKLDGPREQRIDALVADLRQEIGHDHVSVELADRRAASKDWAHMSPILLEKLPATVADVVVRPTSPTGIERAVALAHRHRIPITPRGKGTGNYGQAVPLMAGLVIDTDRCDRVLDVGDGWMSVEAGAKFVLMEQAARRSGQELAQIPSTVGSTVGGFIAGGSGGTGSIESGWNHEGFVEGLHVVPCHTDAQTQVIPREEIFPFCHAYGTTGMISEAIVRLVPQRRWTALFASFADLDTAIEVGQQLVASRPAPRLLSIDDVGVVATLPADPAIPRGRASLRAIIEEDTVSEVRGLVDAAGGKTEEVRPRGPAYLASISFNHVAYRAIKARPELTHLQASGPGLTSRTDEVRAVFEETLLHLDGFKVASGPGFVSIIMTRFEGIEHLYAGIERLAEVEVRVNDPHDWRLHRNLDQIRPVAKEFDPEGLLNPGKLPPAT